MQKIGKIFIGVICLLTLVNAQAQPKRVIHFATDPHYPPFEYLTHAGEMQGFDIDIANALCRQLKAECKITGEVWTDLLTHLAQGRYDAVIAAMSITPSRLQKVDFTHPYYSTRARFVVSQQSKLREAGESLRGERVGVGAETSLYDYLVGTYQDAIDIQTFSNLSNLFHALKIGQIDVAFVENAVAVDWVMKQRRDHFTLLGRPINSARYFGKGVGIAVKKGNNKLRDDLNHALHEIRATHEYKNIHQKYFNSNG